MQERLVQGPDGILQSFPADATDQEISDALNAAPRPLDAPETKKRTWADAVVDALPTMGGALGGLVGGIGGTVGGMGVGGVPGAMGGAALGGMAGEGARDVVNYLRGSADTPHTVSESALGLGKEALTQAALEGGGQMAMKGAKMAAHGLMDFAIRPAPGLAKEFTNAAGDIADTAIRERLPVGRLLPSVGPKGSNLAQAKLREASGVTRGLLDDAGRSGTSFNAATVARGSVTQLAGDVAKQPLSDTELSHLSQMFSEYLSNHGAMTPSMLKDLKQAAQRVAKPIYRAISTGNIPAAGEQFKAQFNKAIAGGAKDALETIPGVAGAEARTESLIGANKAIRQAEVRRLPLIAEMAAPAAGAIAGTMTSGDATSRGTRAAEGAATVMLTRALLSPRTTTRAALGLTTEAIQQALRQMPRAAAYTLLEQLQQGQHDPANSDNGKD